MKLVIHKRICIQWHASIWFTAAGALPSLKYTTKRNEKHVMEQESQIVSHRGPLLDELDNIFILENKTWGSQHVSRTRCWC